MKRTRQEDESTPKLNFILANSKSGKLYEYNLKVFGAPHEGQEICNFPHLKGGGRKSAFYGLYFRPPITTKHKEYCLYILLGEEELVFSSLFFPSNGGKNKVDYLDRTYHCFPSHQLIYDREDPKILYGMFLQLTRTASFDQGGQVEIAIDMGLDCMASLVGRFSSTTFVPYDLPLDYKLDASRLHQRTPRWFIERGEGDMTGTKGYKYLGFWVPTKEEDPGWTINSQPVFTPIQQARVDRGSVSEDPALIMYLTRFPHIRVSLVGWVRLKGSDGWGASPDGLAVDPSSRILPEGIVSSADPSRGIVEIKTSNSVGRVPDMQAYYLPQMYMEMMAAETSWGDLVRFSAQEKRMRVYRVYRHQKTQDRLVELWKYAIAHKHRLQEVVLEEPFVQMRAYLKELASKLEYTEIELTEEMAERIRRYQEYEEEWKRPKLEWKDGAKVTMAYKRCKTASSEVRELVTRIRKDLQTLEDKVLKYLI